jgi:hypothetical protein
VFIHNSASIMALSNERISNIARPDPQAEVMAARAEVMVIVVVIGAIKGLRDARR